MPRPLGEIIHAAGALYILSCNPIALGILKTPKECGADIAVGEGQPLGMPPRLGRPVSRLHGRYVEAHA